MLDTDFFARIFIEFIVLLFSLTVHECAHAWTADRLGDPTARLLGRVSLNPIVHADLIGTVLFPLVAMVANAPLIGWAKPVPVNIRRLRHQRRDYVLVAAAGPASNVVLALGAAIGALPAARVAGDAGRAEHLRPGRHAARARAATQRAACRVQHDPDSAARRRQRAERAAARQAGSRFDSIVRPYGFILLYAIVLTPAFDYLVWAPTSLILSWLR